MAPVDIEPILASLTLEEKISLLAGANFWATVAIPEKGIRALKTSDGPNGARGGDTHQGNSTSTCFPAACSVAATFDQTLAQRIGQALADEAKSKGVDCLLAPTVCIQRHPLGGRNFETFSEDPFLSGKMAANLVNGLQSEGVLATVKHFVANEQETERLTVDTRVSDRALREIYLRPFEIVVKEANPAALMTAYNKVNGEHMDSNSPLIQTVLREQWGWDGLVMSDWGGTNSTVEALAAGLDLEMPGPSRWRNKDAVTAAIASGKLDEGIITQRARRVLEFLRRGNRLGEAETAAATSSFDQQTTEALVREAGAKGIVLLKNEAGILPLTKDKVKGKKIALLGYAKECLAHGGGSAAVVAHHYTAAWDALHTPFGDDVELVYSKGAHTFRRLPSLAANVVGLDGSPGFTLRRMGSDGKAEQTFPLSESELSTFDPRCAYGSEINITGKFTAPEAGRYYFALSGLGPSTFTIDDAVVLRQEQDCDDDMGYLFGAIPGKQVSVSLEKGVEYLLNIHTEPHKPANGQEANFLTGRASARIGCLHEVDHDSDLLAEAVELSKDCDIAIVFTGHDPAWETEGQDRIDFHLPKDGSQDRLVAAVSAAAPKTIVVNSTGSAVALPWLDQVDGLLQCWFAGQEAGSSIADVLTGTQNPEGHLPCTFPKRLEDCPAYGSFPGQHVDGKLKVEYAEGVFVGYRHFDRLPADAVHFPFGFGLSYTTFALSDLAVTVADDNSFTASVKVENSGGCAGAVAVQLYVGKNTPGADSPVKSLAAFDKVRLEAGESSVAQLPINTRDFARFDELEQLWVVDAGTYIVYAGRHAGDVDVSTSIHVSRQTFRP